MDNFYTVLPSNTAIEGNKTSNYTVRLPEPLNLDSNWSVALSSIIYPISFTSLGTQEDQFITLNNELGGEEKIPIPAMNFLSISNLEKGINDAILAYEKEAKPRADHNLTKRAIIENEGQLKTPERIQETPEIIAAVEEFQRMKAGGNVPQENTNQSNDLAQAAIDLEEQKKLLAAQRAIEKAYNQCVALASQVETQAELARAKRQKSERLRRKFPEVAQELYNDLLSLVNTIQDKAVLIGEEAKITANAKNKVIEFKERQNVKEARKVADIAKKAEQNARKLANEAGRLFAGTPEKNYQDGVEQIANKIEFLIHSVTEQSENNAGESAEVEQIPVPQYPADHPKMQQAESEGQEEILTENKSEGNVQNINNESEGKIESTNEGELKTLTRIEESPEIIALAEEFARRKEQAKESSESQDRPIQSQPQPQPSSSTSQPQFGPIISQIPTVQKIEEPKEIIEAVNKFMGRKEQEESKESDSFAPPPYPKNDKINVPKPPPLPIIESSDEEYEWVKPKFSTIKEEKKIEKSSPIKWSVTQNEESIELLPEKKVTEFINKKPEPIRIKGFFIPDENEDEKEDLSSLPVLPKPQALVASHQDETGRDLTIPEQAHRSLMNRLKKIGKMAKIPSDSTQKVQFRYDSVYQKFTVLLQRNIKSIQISKQLAYILGFRTNVNIIGGDTAEYMPDLSGGVKQLYIYAPKLIENTMVGDGLVPLLRVVNVQGKPGEIVESIYSSEFHHRLQSKRITEISIEIRTSSGELVNFHWGNIILTLHWKRSFF